MAVLEAILAPDADPMQAPVHVRGARGRFTRAEVVDAIDEATEEREALVQAFDPASIYGARHLEAAARRALRAHREGRATARDPGVEMALYAAGTTQIEDAFDRVGLPAEGHALLLASVGPEREPAAERVLEVLGLDRDDELVAERAEALDRLGIGEDLLEAVDEEERTLLVLEHVALLDARK